MHKFRKILFAPLAKKNNPAAARRVADLAERNGATLTVVGIVSEPHRLGRFLDRPVVDHALREAEQEAMIARLDKSCSEAGYEHAASQVLSGDAPLAIVQKVLVDDYDLVVVTTDEDREDNATIKRLLRKCPCPVWVIRPTRARTQRVLAAVNPDPAEAALNLDVLELATSLQELYGGELHVVHAWDCPGEATLRSSAFLAADDDEVERFVSEEREAHRRALDDLLATADHYARGEPDRTVHLDRGRAAAVISELVRHHRINVLVMGTVARTGVPGLIVGNTAEQLFDDLGCSVIALKPPGFVSPVPRPRRV